MSTRTGGFTLLELLVALFVLMVLTLMAVQIFFAATEQQVLYERTLPPPAVSLALRQLKQDAAASSGVSSGSSTWSRSPLVLNYADGRRFRYRLTDRELVREVFEPGDFTPGSARLMVPDVTTFRWAITGVLLTIEIERTSFLAAQPRPGRPLPPGLLLDERIVTVRLRGAGGHWW
ncbi:MAG: prepilin-type N-terminal cleavage/methylation domain-containing protein [Acidobacteriota bacterium]